MRYHSLGFFKVGRIRFLGIIDQGGQLVAVLQRDRVAEQLVDPGPDHAGTGVDQMTECFVLAMHVGNKMLAAFGQVHNGLEIDDLAAGCLDGGELLGQKIQVTQLFGGINLGFFHGKPHDTFC